MIFLEHYITLPLIKKYIKFLMLLVKSNIFGTILNAQDMHETNPYLNNCYMCWLDKSFAFK
jgi:hypothetical protein